MFLEVKQRHIYLLGKGNVKTTAIEQKVEALNIYILFYTYIC